MKIERFVFVHPSTRIVLLFSLSILCWLITTPAGWLFNKHPLAMVVFGLAGALVAWFSMYYIWLYRDEYNLNFEKFKKESSTLRVSITKYTSQLLEGVLLFSSSMAVVVTLNPVIGSSNWILGFIISLIMWLIITPLIAWRKLIKDQESSKTINSSLKPSS